MLTIKVDADPGTFLGDAFIEMLDVARRTGCRVDMKGNGVTFSVRPDDTVDQLRDCYRRLYAEARPASELVATHVIRPLRPLRALRDPEAATMDTIGIITRTGQAVRLNDVALTAALEEFRAASKRRVAGPADGDISAAIARYLIAAGLTG